jgi:hypothetical protein
MSKMYVNELLPKDAATITAPNLQLPAGSVIQVVQAFKTDVSTISSTTYASIPGLSVNITPKFITSKFLISMSVAFSARTTLDSLYAAFGRNNAVITSSIGDAASNRPRATVSIFPGDASGVDNFQGQGAQTYLDSPSTLSQITYSVMMRTANGNSMAINRTWSDRDTIGYDGRWTSSITVMEIAQ